MCICNDEVLLAVIFINCILEGSHDQKNCAKNFRLIDRLFLDTWIWDMNQNHYLASLKSKLIVNGNTCCHIFSSTTSYYVLHSNDFDKGFVVKLSSLFLWTTELCHWYYIRLDVNLKLYFEFIGHIFYCFKIILIGTTQKIFAGQWFVDITLRVTLPCYPYFTVLYNFE